ncbi:MAG: aldo/keto reductase, partial [Anaerolineae bacterium]|nr:aldo/keto reductase [Anaerolineae bacterium]
EYRRFGRLDWKVSALGFGCMRLPTVGGDRAQIDEQLATRMLHYAIDHGVNYIDTAYPYHGGNSERFLGRALQGGYRDRVRLATKMPCWLIGSRDDFDRYLNEQLARLQMERVDFYLLHSLSAASWRKVRDLGVLEWAEGARRSGRFAHLGFSFHDRYAVFQEIVDAYDGWDLCQIQYNYMDVDNQAGTRGLRYAAGRGLAVVIMEPLLGGRLATPPEAVQGLWDSAARKRTAVEWALQWLWNQPEVAVALSGMSAMAQVAENVASAARSGVNTLTAEEVALVDRVRATYLGRCPIPCTQCQYCLPCPNGLNVPRLLELLNSVALYGGIEQARRAYQRTPQAERADACQACRHCEEACPQHIPVSEWMARIHGVLGEGRPLREALKAG